jgi:PAS domain S-box-containing protein
MFGIGDNLNRWIARNRYSALVQYAGAALAVWVALSLWTLSPVLHRHLFVLLLAAVLFTARFLGLGPAVFCSLVSTACLDFFAVPPYFSFGISTSADLERLLVFLAISVFAGSMARQKTLAESRADRTTREMAAIVESSCDAIYSSHPDGTITSWNRAAEQLYGYTAEEAVGSPVARLSPPERLDELARNLEILHSGGHVASYRTERMRKDGTRCPVLLSVSSLRNARGEIVGASAIARDITAEKQSEEAIRRSEKLATAGRLAASIAHEINNPLEAVVNLLYLARHDSSNAAEYLTMAEQEVGRVAQLAQQTLGFVRDASAPGAMDPHGRDFAVVFPQTGCPAYSRDPTLPQPSPSERLFGRVAAVAGQSSGKRGGCHGRGRFSASPRGGGPRLVDRQGRRPHHGGRQRQRNSRRQTAPNLRTVLHDQERHWDGPRIMGLARHCREARWIDSGAKPRTRTWHRPHYRNRIFDLFTPGPPDQPGGVSCAFLICPQ